MKLILKRYSNNLVENSSVRSKLFTKMQDKDYYSRRRQDIENAKEEKYIGAIGGSLLGGAVGSAFKGPGVIIGAGIGGYGGYKLGKASGKANTREALGKIKKYKNASERDKKYLREVEKEEDLRREREKDREIQRQQARAQQQIAYNSRRYYY